MNIQEKEARIAIELLDELFPEVEEQKMPADATREQLWERILELERKPIKKPRVADAVRLLVESKECIHLPFATIALVVREVFSQHGFTNRCSESSVRWYLSQCQDWSPKQRRKICT